MPTVTIRDVAQEAGVSIGSVSRLLSGDTTFRARPETEYRVRAAAERLGYQANPGARLLRQQKPTMVGIAVSTSALVNSSVNNLVRALQAELIQQEHEPILVEPHLMIPSGTRPSFPSPSLLKGLISADLQLELQIPDFYNALRNKLPVIALYPTSSEEIDTVTVDRVDSVFQVVRCLVHKGHKRIMFVGLQDKDHPSIAPRWEGWNKAVHEFDLQDSYKFEVPPLNKTAYGDAVLSIDYFLAQNPRPTAIVFSSEEISIHGIRLLVQSGIKVGKEVEVASMLTGPLFSENVDAPVTFTENPIEQIAQISVRKLISIAEDRDQETTDRQTLIRPNLLTIDDSGTVTEVRM
jgi:LacI family repressor for deo operon, udp, cdd, tsx, nupC, and nupG